jgi:transposase
MFRKSRGRRGMSLEDRPVEQPHAAGVDIGAREIFVAVPHDPEAQPVRKFATFTEDLWRLADWLQGCGVTTVAMESTGVFWIPLYELLEQRGLKPCVVNARHMKNVPGRRTDWHECQWIQFLHSVGLLRAAFRPEEQVCAVRAIVRHRQQLVEMAAQHVQHMQKAMTLMNLQLQHVLSDITGTTGLAIVDAIVVGERDPKELSKLRDPRVKASSDVIEKSLCGNWREEHLFTLGQSRQFHRFYQEQIVICETNIERLLQQFDPRVDPQQTPLPPDNKCNRSGAKRRKKAGHVESQFDLRTEAYKLFGVDVTQIPGLETNVLPLFGEVGRDLSRWPTTSHFISWLSLCPDNDISGGRVLWRGMRKTNNRAGQIFRLAAQSLHRSPTPIGEYLRRLKAKLGPAGAITATARKIATLFYTLVTRQVEFDHTLWHANDAQRQQRIQARLTRQARRLGYQLVPLEVSSCT